MKNVYGFVPKKYDVTPYKYDAPFGMYRAYFRRGSDGMEFMLGFEGFYRQEPKELTIFCKTQENIRRGDCWQFVPGIKGHYTTIKAAMEDIVKLMGR